MTVVIADVRKYLNDLPTEPPTGVSDSVIEQRIKLAQAKIDAEKSKDASTSVVDNAVLTEAGYQVYLAYATTQERNLGMVPQPIITHLRYLEDVAKYFLSLAKRSAASRALDPIKLTESIVFEWQRVDEPI